jgi:hypothetical protein
MPTNSETIVEQILATVKAMLATAQDPPVEDASPIYEIEGALFAQLLALGRQILTLRLMCAAERLRPKVATDPQGRTLPYFGQKRRSFLSIFGKITFTRSYYWAGTGSGWFPLDAALNLPTTSLSDRLREWREALGVAQAYHAAGAILRGFFGVATSSRSVQMEILEDGPEVEAYYAQAEAPETEKGATILVVQSDGKGVPMIADEPEETKVRLGKGEKRGHKKEAIVTALYTQAPRVRTPEAVVRSLFDAVPEEPGPKVAATGPVGKQVWATLTGKAAALAFTAEQAQRRDGPTIVDRVALTDGSAPLQERVQAAFPGYTLVLDFIHALGYLWKSANALLGEKAPTRTGWVRERALQLLSGQTQTVIDELRDLASAPERTPVQRETLETVAGYYERNAAFMAYDRYLARGWPIATGVVEGACGHLVKDRCEQSGMRWTQAGAEALLRLRSVAENGDWERFHAYRRAKRHREVYGVSDTNDLDIEAGDDPLDLWQPSLKAA